MSSGGVDRLVRGGEEEGNWDGERGGSMVMLLRFAF